MGSVSWRFSQDGDSFLLKYHTQKHNRIISSIEDCSIPKVARLQAWIAFPHLGYLLDPRV